MDRDQLIVSGIVKQRNDALDALVMTQADRDVVVSSLKEAQARIAELEAEIEKLKAPEAPKE